MKNSEKLRKAFPELELYSDSLTEDIECNDLVKKAVGILYDMDDFVMSVYDNEYWLMMGPGDGEFVESSRADAEANCAEHKWLVTDFDSDMLSKEDLEDHIKAFKISTEDDEDYDASKRLSIISEAEQLLHMNEDTETPEEPEEVKELSVVEEPEEIEASEVKAEVLTEAPIVTLTDNEMNNPDSIDFKDKIAKDIAAEEEEKACIAAEERKATLRNRYRSVINDINKSMNSGDKPEDTLEVAFEHLVPSAGEAETVAGECVRAMMRLIYRCYNDGDKFYEGYGIETCASSAGYLMDTVDTVDQLFRSVLEDAYRYEDDTAYEEMLNNAALLVLKYILDTPETLEEENTTDSRTEEHTGYDHIVENQPKYEMDIDVSDDVHRLVEEGIVDSWKLNEYVESQLEWNSAYDGAQVDRPFSHHDTSVSVSNLTKDGYEVLQDSIRDLDAFWSDLYEEYKDELEDSEEDSDEYDDDIDESYLMEGPISWLKKKIDKDGTYAAAKAADSRAKEDRKMSAATLKLIARDFSGDAKKGHWAFYIKNGSKYDVLSADEYVAKYNGEYDPTDASSIPAEMANAIVVDENGYYVRRGLEDFLGKNFKFVQGKNDTIKPGFLVKDASAADGDTAKSETDKKDAADDTAKGDSAASTTDSKDTATEDSTADSEEKADDTDKKSTDGGKARYDLGISKKTYAQFLKLAYLMKPQIFDAFNKPVKLNSIADVKKLTYNNLPDYQIVINGKKQELVSWIQNAAKNKALVEAIINHQNDKVTNTKVGSDVIFEGMTAEERAELWAKAKEIGIKSGKDANTFMNREVADDETVYSAMNRYRDELGDDFQLVDESLDESLDDEYEEYQFVSFDEFTEGMMNNVSDEEIDTMLDELQKVAKALKVDENALVILVDAFDDLDPDYFRGVNHVGNLTSHFQQYECDNVVFYADRRSPIIFCFKNKQDAIEYIDFCNGENI